MNHKKINFISVILFSIVIAGLLSVRAYADTETKESQFATAPAPQAAIEKPVPIKTKYIDKAGDAIGKSVDSMSGKASTRMGGWIDSRIYADITWFKLLVCFAFLFVVIAFERMLNWLITTKIEEIPKIEGAISWARIFLNALSKPLSLFIWVYGGYWAISPLIIHFQSPEGTNLVHIVLQKAADIGGTFAIVWFIYRFISVIDIRIKSWAKKSDSNVDEVLVPIIGKTLRVFIVIVGGMILIQNLTGVKITPLLASLGIGGLAIALASKDSISNFFGTLTIIFDKPFQVGERIVINNYDGIVEEVGFRTTRVRTLTGHLVSIPNEKVVNSALENIGKRPYIRWLTNIGITYDTPPAKVDRAVQIISSILDNHEGMREDFPPRVYFNGFNDWNLNIMVIAWYHPAAYWDYQAWLQRTCLEIMKQFREEEIKFAFPSQTIYMTTDEGKDGAHSLN